MRRQLQDATEERFTGARCGEIDGLCCQGFDHFAVAALEVLRGEVGVKLSRLLLGREKEEVDENATGDNESEETKAMPDCVYVCEMAILY